VLQREQKVDSWIAPIFVEQSMYQPFVQHAPYYDLSTPASRGLLFTKYRCVRAWSNS